MRLALKVLSYRYGYGAEHILEMDVVLADGTIAHVYPNRWFCKAPHHDYFYTFRTIFSNSSEIIHTSGNDLFFGLRGAGSSLAIVTEFLYTVYRKPETKPAVLLIWLNNQDDFDNILQVTLYSPSLSAHIHQDCPNQQEVQFYGQSTNIKTYILVGKQSIALGDVIFTSRHEASEN